MSFIGIRIQHETARLLTEIDVPGERTDSASLHITLLYLGENTPIKELAKALVATYDITQETCPFLIKTSAISCFPVEEGNPHPIIAQVQSTKLIELHKQLKRSFNKSNIEYNKKFKTFHPHITLSFNKEAIKRTKIEPIEWSVQELVLWAGDKGDNKLYSVFPLEIRKNCQIECETKESK
jgi:2'-5' RNA ligase